MGAGNCLGRNGSGKLFWEGWEWESVLRRIGSGKFYNVVVGFERECKWKHVQGGSWVGMFWEGIKVGNNGRQW